MECTFNSRLWNKIGQVTTTMGIQERTGEWMWTKSDEKEGKIVEIECISGCIWRGGEPSDRSELSMESRRECMQKTTFCGRIFSYHGIRIHKLRSIN